MGISQSLQCYDDQSCKCKYLQRFPSTCPWFGPCVSYNNKNRNVNWKTYMVTKWTKHSCHHGMVTFLHRCTSGYSVKHGVRYTRMQWWQCTYDVDRMHKYKSSFTISSFVPQQLFTVSLKNILTCTVYKCNLRTLTPFYVISNLAISGYITKGYNEPVAGVDDWVASLIVQQYLTP